jgi:hypothetical protein
MRLIRMETRRGYRFVRRPRIRGLALPTVLIRMNTQYLGVSSGSSVLMGIGAAIISPRAINFVARKMLTPYLSM